MRVCVRITVFDLLFHNTTQYYTKTIALINMAGVTANYPVSEASTAAFRWVVPRGFMELESCGNQKRMYSAGQPQLARFRFFRLVKRKQISRSNFLLKSTCL